MSNPSTPFGFEDIPLLDGAASTFGLYEGKIATNNTNSIYRGDVLTLTAGFFTKATAVGGGASVAGIAESFEWLSISAGMRLRSRAWLGATGDVAANSSIIIRVKMHPHMRFRVRTSGLSGSAVAQANIGSNINFSAGSGPGVNLVSTYSADDNDMGAGASLPFKILGLADQPDSDSTSVNNIIIVGFNNLVLP